MFLDCYCCAASVLYAYVQIAFYVTRPHCVETMPVICIWLLIEVLYQYFQILNYIVESLSVLCCIVKQRRLLQQKQKAKLERRNSLQGLRANRKVILPQ